MIVPSGEIMTVRSGSFLPLIRIASDTALTNPPQHGTCILTAVMLFISFPLIIAASFSE